MKYKYIALDLDGTLTNSKKEITPRTVSALQKAAEKGVRIILASGRPPAGILPLAEQLALSKLGGYILAYNGGHAIDCRSGTDVLRRVIDPSLYKDICLSSRKFGVNLLTYGNGGVLTECVNDPYVQQECRINRIEAFEVPSLYRAISEPVCKFLAVGKHEKLRPLQSYCRERYRSTLNVFFSELYFLEIVPPGIEKAASLALLLERLNGKASELIACGDGLNDITMIDYAGLGVAMENAQPSVLARADYITASNDEEGVAEVVEKFLLSKENEL